MRYNMKQLEYTPRAHRVAARSTNVGQQKSGYMHEQKIAPYNSLGATPPRNSPLAIEQIIAVQECLAQLGQDTQGMYTLLADGNGQSLGYWCRLGDIESKDVAALVAADMLASGEMGYMFGQGDTERIIIQEHDEYRVLMLGIEGGAVLLLTTPLHIPLGWARLAARRATESLRQLLTVR